MNRWIDIHSHILPGVDDGASNIRVTRHMLKIAWEDGITDIIATPHYQPRRFQAGPRLLQERFLQVQEEAHRISPDLNIYLGSELMASSDIQIALEKGEALTMAGSRYVLVEFMPGVVFSDMRSTMGRLQQFGYYPILAHAERYQCLLDDNLKVEDLTDRGVYIQVNAGSIAGENGWNARFFTRKLLKYNMVDMLGTDAHSVRTRKPVMSECMKYINKKCERNYVRQLAYENALAVLQNTRL